MKVRLLSNRKRILELIKEAKSHPSIKQIYEMYQSQYDDEVCFATIYNNVHYLEKHNLIRVATNHNNTARYDVIMEEHDHFICLKCGAIEDIESTKNSSNLSKYPHLKVDYQTTKYYGVCENCQADNSR